MYFKLCEVFGDSHAHSSISMARTNQYLLFGQAQKEREEE